MVAFHCKFLGGGLFVKKSLHSWGCAWRDHEEMTIGQIPMDVAAVILWITWENSWLTWLEDLLVLLLVMYFQKPWRNNMKLLGLSNFKQKQCCWQCCWDCFNNSGKTVLQQIENTSISPAWISEAKNAVDLQCGECGVGRNLAVSPSKSGLFLPKRCLFTV